MLTPLQIFGTFLVLFVTSESLIVAPNVHHHKHVGHIPEVARIKSRGPSDKHPLATWLKSLSLTQQVTESGKSKQFPGSDDDDSDYEQQSGMDRLGEAISSFFGGLLLVIPFSIALLWMNESRNAKLESIISLGESEAQTVDAMNDDAQDGTLVHMNSEEARGMDVVKDARFDFEISHGCVRLLTKVEVFQWKETEHKEETKNNVGGGKTIRKWYTYEQVWSDQIIDSSSFHKSGYENKVSVEGLKAGTTDRANSKVMYGKHFLIPENKVNDLCKFEDASELLGKELKFKTYTFEPSGEYYRYPPAGDSEASNGDFRVRITYVKDGPATILALQMKGPVFRTFGPYRSIKRGCCCTPEEELKIRRLEAARKSEEELFEEERCPTWGPFCCLCLCCNVVHFVFSLLQNVKMQGGATFSLTPQVYSAWDGKKTKQECFQSEKRAASMAKWIIRVVGWLLLWIGFMMMCEPIEVLLDFIPFLGPYLGSGVAAALAALTFIFTVVVATFIVSIAYLIYHPCLGIFYLVIVGGIVYGFMFGLDYLQAMQEAGSL